MRIALMTPTLGESYGTEQVVRQTGEGLIREGHAVYFLAERQSGPMPAFTGGEFLDQLYSINSLSKSAMVSATLARLMRFTQAAAPDLIHLMDQLDPKLLKPLVNSYPVVLTSHTVATTSPSSCRVINGDQICTVKSSWMCLWHNKRFGCLNYLKDDLRRAHALYEFLKKKRAYRSVGAVLGPSRYICDLLSHDGWNPERIHYAPNPVMDLAVDSLTRPPKNLLSIASRLVPMKGIDRVLRALKLIESLEWTLWICGEGPERGRLIAEAERLGIGARVIFKGSTSQIDTHTIIKSSAIFLQPNLGPESFGLAAAEASSLGVAVVGFDVPGLNETVIHAKTGLLAKRGDVEDLSRAISDLLMNPLKARALGTAGAAHVRERFSQSIHIAATLHAYEAAIAAFGR